MIDPGIPLQFQSELKIITKKIIFTLSAIGLSSIAMAQTTVIRDTSCSFLKNIKFRDGVDTVEVKANFHAFTEGSDEPYLKILADEKKLQFAEYLDPKYDSNALSFIPVDCNKRYDATISRKVYDKTFARKTNDIAAYMKNTVDLDNLKRDQVIYLKCIVYEEKRVRNKHGQYFFTIIDVVPEEPSGDK